MVKRHNGKLKHAPPKHRTPITASPIHKDAPKKRQVGIWEAEGDYPPKTP
jgi:hypothetical protein